MYCLLFEDMDKEPSLTCKTQYYDNNCAYCVIAIDPVRFPVISKCVKNGLKPLEKSAP